MVLKHFALYSFRVFSPQGVVGEKKKERGNADAWKHLE